jgi:hypothetical protein
MLSSFVQSPRPGQKHACHQNAERDVVKRVRENVHGSRPIAAYDSAEKGNLSADISPQRQKTALRHRLPYAAMAVGDGEHHAGQGGAWGFFDRNDRIGSLWLYSHTQTKKNP